MSKRTKAIKHRYYLYDRLTEQMLMIIHRENHDCPEIALYGVNPWRDSHKWVIQTALDLCSLGGRRLCLDVGWLARKRLHRKFAKRFKLFGRSPRRDNFKTVDGMLAELRPYACEITKQETFDFGEIYRGYMQIHHED